MKMSSVTKQVAHVRIFDNKRMALANSLSECFLAPKGCYHQVNSPLQAKNSIWKEDQSREEQFPGGRPETDLAVPQDVVVEWEETQGGEVERGGFYRYLITNILEHLYRSGEIYSGE